MFNSTLIRILLLIVLITPFAHLQAQDKLTLATKLMDEAEQDPDSKMNTTKINTAVLYLEEALKGHRVNCEHLSLSENINGEEFRKIYLLISPIGEHRLNRFANSMYKLGVDVIFDPHYLISKKAIASFDEANGNRGKAVMNLSREFIEDQGGSDKLSIRHETRHLLTSILEAMGYDSIFISSLSFENDNNISSYKDGFRLDEIAAWSEDVYGYTRKLEAEFIKAYVGFHPDIKNILHDLDVYSKEKNISEDPLCVLIRNEIANIVYSYSKGRPTTEADIKKINKLLKFFYLDSDQEKVEITKSKIVNLSNRDLTIETYRILEGLVIDYYDAANSRKINELIQSIWEAAHVLKGLTTKTIEALDSIEARSRSISFLTSTRKGYQKTWKYTSGLLINYRVENNSITGNKVHVFIVLDEARNNTYRVKIATEKEYEDPREMLFMRMWEQVQTSKKIQDNNILLIHKIEDYVKTVKMSKENKITPQEKIKIRRELVKELLEYSKKINNINKEVFSSDISVKEAISTWKDYQSNIIEPVKEIPKTIIPQNETTEDDDQFCQYGFDNIDRLSTKGLTLKNKMIKSEDAEALLDGYLKAGTKTYQEKIELLFQKILNEGAKIGDAEIDLFFGDQNLAGERAGGLFNYWKQNPDYEENWMYIALIGALVSESHYGERDITLTVYKAYFDAGIIYKPTDIIKSELEKSLTLSGIRTESVVLKIEATKISSKTSLVKKVH